MRLKESFQKVFLLKPSKCFPPVLKTVGNSKKEVIKEHTIDIQNFNGVGIQLQRIVIG